MTDTGYYIQSRFCAVSMNIKNIENMLSPLVKFSFQKNPKNGYEYESKKNVQGRRPILRWEQRLGKIPYRRN